MKAGSDNFRQSASMGVLDIVKKLGATVIIYEPSIREESAFGCMVLDNFEAFADQCDVILANRWDNALTPVKRKVYCRDLWKRD